MLLTTIDTSSMHSISSLLDTITHLTPGTQPGETTRQRNADNGSLEKEREKEGECVCVYVDTVGCHPSNTTKREGEGGVQYIKTSRPWNRRTVVMS